MLFKKIINKINSTLFENKMKDNIGKRPYVAHGWEVLNPSCIKIGDNFGAKENLSIQAWTKYKTKKFNPEIIIGNDVKVMSNCMISCVGKISIGDGCLFGDNVFVTDNFHGTSEIDDINISPMNRELYFKGPVSIGKNVWIGRNVSIMPNVVIDDGAIIGANSVVTHNIQKNCIACGCPAKVIKEIKSNVKNPPLVSIVAPTYNVSEYIRSFVDCIIDQTYQNWELILVDDGSSDNTCGIIEEYLNQDGRIKYLHRGDAPKGANACRNIGKKNSKGEFIIFFDSDDLVSKNCLEQRVSFMIKHPNIDYSTFKGVSVQETDDGELLYLDQFWGVPVNTDLIDGFLSVNYPFAVWNNIYRADSLKDIDWDERLLIYQDFDYMIRCICENLNHEFAKNQEVDYYYRINRPGAMTKKFVTKERYDSTKYLFSKTLKELDTLNKCEHYQNKFKKFFRLQLIRVVDSDDSYLISDFIDYFSQNYQNISKFRFYAVKQIINIRPILNTKVLHLLIRIIL